MGLGLTRSIRAATALAGVVMCGALLAASAGADDRIYWANLGDDTIRTAPLAGGVNSTALYDSADGVASPNGVAIDGGHIYWSSFAQDRIRRAPLSGSGPVEIVYGPNQGVRDTEGLAIDPVARRIYWANANAMDTSIRSAPTSGAGPVDIIYDESDGVDAPRGLTVDPSTGRIYWSNRGDESMRRAPLSGAGTPLALYTGNPLGSQLRSASRSTTRRRACIRRTSTKRTSSRIVRGRWASRQPLEHREREREESGRNRRRQRADLPGARRSTTGFVGRRRPARAR